LQQRIASDALEGAFAANALLIRHGAAHAQPAHVVDLVIAVVVLAVADLELLDHRSVAGAPLTVRALLLARSADA
jgi:hypothetical protein